MRYNLDGLGAYQFEQLTQSLLKVYAGLSVESWGRRSDFGRDAYTPNALHFPDKESETTGPFLFQVKFVEGANAAGAKPDRALSDSVSKEIACIKERKLGPNWTEPSHFIFLTNSLIEASLRERIWKKLKSILPDSVIITFGGDDICDFLDGSPDIYRSFPQLYSIRDLDVLLQNALTHESRIRSAAAIEIARELVPVFAPTSNYEKAWSVLHKNHFAVLQGPPEVGKSAIAWMIGLSQVADGWEVASCQEPKEFFEMYDPSAKQIFIADDAFGRTEYDPTHALKWERDLDLVLHRVDAHHWLIWTSRTHILERAVNRMDVTGRARSFPEPGAVLVDMSALSVEEKALMLFRHTRAAHLDSIAKNLVRSYASQITANLNSTPERIRRFVSESLPALVAETQLGILSREEISATIDEAIKNPTKQMQLTFRGLPMALKWYLVSMLEMPRGWRITEAANASSFGEVRAEGQRLVVLPALSADSLERKYISYCPEEKRIPFQEATQYLSGAFIRLWGKGRLVDWIHPGYRDFVIDELTSDSEMRTQFLERASLEGLKLAVSDSGGQEGLRRLPFLLSAESWDVIERRALAIVRAFDQDRDLLEVLSSAAERSYSSKDREPRWERLISAVCCAVKEKWDASSRRLESADIAAFRRCRSAINSNQDLPDLLGQWLSLEQTFREADRSFIRADLELIRELARFAEEAEMCIPGFLDRRGFLDQFESAIEPIFAGARREFSALEFSHEDEDIREFVSRASELADACDRMSRIPIPNSRDDRLQRPSIRLGVWAAELWGMAYELGLDESVYGFNEEHSLAIDDFDIGALFAEL